MNHGGSAGSFVATVSLPFVSTSFFTDLRHDASDGSDGWVCRSRTAEACPPVPTPTNTAAVSSAMRRGYLIVRMVLHAGTCQEGQSYRAGPVHTRHPARSDACART